MKTCYINGTGCISNQNTFETEFLSEVTINTTENVIYANQPSYKEFISPGASRRMAKGVKMGIAASSKALKEANVEIPEAIIIGTGMGCVEDSEKFLKSILDNKEEFLTPTSFIQSTHNTVGGQIALGLQCKGYNFTYVNGAVSFETALMDAKMQIENNEAESILVGGIDETGAYTLSLHKLINLVKSEEDKPYSVLNSDSKGIVHSEGAGFFVLENEKKESSYASVEAVSLQSSLDAEEVSDFIANFLETNNLKISDIDAVVLGNNGDIEFDNYYDVSNSLFEKTPQVYYKHLSGEYNTASAFGFWTAANIIKNQSIPETVSMNALKSETYNTLLLYNQYRGKDHSLILLKKC
ncbi:MULTISPECIES: beta-ketoacyl synthase N-terminal-like domain-containing protein [Flavobacterium]|uniref:beta-ketoacyl synthase N-terminal-like domain-containing protein n=1 Tax=Flavobacterium TaxID=237 RepID=UPI001FCB035E|nr:MULTISPECIES: beta-ketoacyl synthase N-terminal-like domain-containing protein [Flavobacterium]UOK42944.1 beta-ketoacyl synthase chain length factor [Flavobacterium enshiense]